MNELEKHLYNQSLRKGIIPKDHIKYLWSLKKGGFNPKVIYDIGSNLLFWTNEVKEIFPDAKIILFEAYPKLEFLYKNYDYHIGCLSDKDNKSIKFYHNERKTGGNSYYKEYNDEIFPEDQYITLKSETLDSVVEKYNFPKPDFIKMDVQGAELDIIKGGKNTISYCKKMILELQKVEYNIGAPLKDDVINYMNKIDFYCCDPLFCNNGPDGDYGFINLNPKDFL
jgi:FkbM family methyltransferase